MLTNEYKELETGLKGRNSFFYKINEKYIGIFKQKVAVFLKNNKTHQIHK